jgi:hypothetical protein
MTLCSRCRSPLDVAAGDTREKQVAALKAWPGCGCEETVS